MSDGATYVRLGSDEGSTLYGYYMDIEHSEDFLTLKRRYSKWTIGLTSLEKKLIIVTTIFGIAVICLSAALAAAHHNKTPPAPLSTTVQPTTSTTSIPPTTPNSTTSTATPSSTTSSSTTPAPPTSSSTTPAPTTSSSTTPAPTTSSSTTPAPTTSSSTTPAPTTSSSTTPAPTTSSSTTPAPTTSSTTTTAPTTSSSSIPEPTTKSSPRLSATSDPCSIEEGCRFSFTSNGTSHLNTQMHEVVNSSKIVDLKVRLNGTLLVHSNTDQIIKKLPGLTNITLDKSENLTEPVEKDLGAFLTNQTTLTGIKVNVKQNTTGRVTGLLQLSGNATILDSNNATIVRPVDLEMLIRQNITVSSDADEVIFDKMSNSTQNVNFTAAIDETLKQLMLKVAENIQNEHIPANDAE